MLILICGIPNAGKTTYSQKYNNVIHLDDVIRTSVICEMVAREDDVCVEGVFVDARRRKKIAEVYEGKKICIWLDTPEDVCISRESRNRSEGLIKCCSQSFEPPTLDEGWDEIIIIRGDDNVERISREKQT